MFYNWHRFYDPETGRYITADPIGLSGGMNLYVYVGGDPVNWVDIEGLLKSTGVYFCSEGFLPDLKNIGKDYPHSWVCNNGDCKGLQPTIRPKDRSSILKRALARLRNVFALGYGEINSDYAYFDSEKCHEIKLSDCCDENEFKSCVSDKLNSKDTIRYGLFLYNCSSWAKGVINSCRNQACTSE